MSFTSSLPADLPKYGLLPTRDFATGREQYARITRVHDYAVGADGHIPIRSGIDFVASPETSAMLLSQLDRAFASERPDTKIVETFLIRLLDADSGRGAEPGFTTLTPKYFDLRTWKTTTEPTLQSVFIGLGGVSGCVVVGDVKLCYKKLGDVLDWETVRDLLTAFKQIDDKVRELLNIINKELFNQP